MTIVFKSILGMTMVGSVLLIIILLVTPITKKVFSSRWHSYSRIAVLMFFFLPIGTVAVKSFEKFTYMLLKSGSPAMFDFWQEIPAPLAIGAFSTEIPPNASHSVLESILEFLPYIWFAGTILFLLLKFFQLVRFKRLVSKSSEQITNKAILTVFEKVKKDMQIYGYIELISDFSVSTPMLIGFVRAQLVLPKTDLSENELELVFRHELTHYRHGDLWIKLAVMVACAVHWFNPFVYLLKNSLERFLEASCDAGVVKNMDYDERRVYGAAILNALGSTAGSKTSVYAAFSSNQKNMKKRLTDMLNEKKPSRKVTFISIFVLLLICVVGISVSAAAHKDPLESMIPVASHNSNQTNKFVNSHGVVWTKVKDVQKELNLIPNEDDDIDSTKYYTVILVDNEKYTIVSAEYDADFFELSEYQLIEDTKKYLNRRNRQNTR